MKERLASVLVRVPDDWLTNGGHDPEIEGWLELQGRINDALREVNHDRRYTFNANNPIAEFNEWLETAEGE